jgi:hypothetical protein
MSRVLYETEKRMAPLPVFNGCRETQLKD